MPIPYNLKYSNISQESFQLSTMLKVLSQVIARVDLMFICQQIQEDANTVSGRRSFVPPWASQLHVGPSHAITVAREALLRCLWFPQQLHLHSMWSSLLLCQVFRNSSGYSLFEMDCLINNYCFLIQIISLRNSNFVYFIIKSLLNVIEN